MKAKAKTLASSSLFMAAGWFRPTLGYKYPIIDDIPVMLVEVGQKYKDVAVDDLPVPPPREDATPSESSD